MLRSPNRQMAARIITIQNILQTKYPRRKIRDRLIAEQRTLWDIEFPGSSFDEIAELALH